MATRALPLLRCSLESIHNVDAEPDESRLTKKWLRKAIALCKDLWPSANHDTLSVKYLSHGSYNTVFTLSMETADGQLLDYVLRIADGDYPIARTAAIHEYLTEFTDLKVPRVITWDATEDNPLENSYIIMSRIPGKCLQAVWGDLSHSQKLLLAQKMAELLLQIESFTNQVAGTIMVHKNGLRHSDNVSDRMFVEAFGADVLEIPSDPINWLNADNGLLPLDRLRHDPPNLSTNDIMSAIFKRRIYQTKNRETDSQSYLLEYFEPCREMIKDMVDGGVFQPESDVICLHHPDLFPRNIMVDFSPELTITGVLDWDVALFMPRFVGRAPPCWLWRSVPQDNSEYAKFDMEPLDPDDIEPDSPENEEIKKAFETAVGENWVSESTGKPYRFARRVLRFGRQDSYDTDDMLNLLDWIYEWKPSDDSALDVSAEEVADGGEEVAEDGEQKDTHDETAGDEVIVSDQQGNEHKDTHDETTEDKAVTSDKQDDEQKNSHNETVGDESVVTDQQGNKQKDTHDETPGDEAVASDQRDDKQKVTHDETVGNEAVVTDQQDNKDLSEKKRQDREPSLTNTKDGLESPHPNVNTSAITVKEKVEVRSAITESPSHGGSRIVLERLWHYPFLCGILCGMAVQIVLGLLLLGFRWWSGEVVCW